MDLGNRVSDLLTAYAMALLREMGIRTKQEEQRMEGYAAVVVQSQWRRVQAVKDMAAKNKDKPKDKTVAVHVVQRLFRGFQVRNSMSKEVAAILLQSVWRGYKERCRFDEMITAMEEELMDAGLTEEDAKEEAAQTMAALHMQRNFRGFQVRRCETKGDKGRRGRIGR